MEETAEWLQSLGSWAIVASILLNIVIGIAGVIPTVFLSGANAVVFGLVPGFIISLVGECIAAVVSFYLYRWGVIKLSQKPSQSRFWGKLSILREQTRTRKMIIVLFARITPFVPSGLVTLAAAISGMPVLDFAVVTVLGKMPSIAAETLIGHDLFYIKDRWERLAAVGAVLVLVLLILKRPNKK